VLPDQGPKRLVENENFGFVHDCLGDGELLAQAAQKRHGLFSQPAGQVETLGRRPALNMVNCR